jgi:hypothetical protein
MAAGLPVAASRMGALPELLPADQLAPPDDAPALGVLARRLRGDADVARAGQERIRRIAAPGVVAPLLAGVYAGRAPQALSARSA